MIRISSAVGLVLREQGFYMTKIIFTFAGHPDLLVQRTYKKIRNLGEEKRYDLGLLPVVPGTVRGVPYSVALQAFLSYIQGYDRL